MYMGLHAKYLLFLSGFNRSWPFSRDFRKNTQISNFIKIRPLGAELFDADMRRDRRDEAKTVFIRTPMTNHIQDLVT